MIVEIVVTSWMVSLASIKVLKTSFRNGNNNLTMKLEILLMSQNRILKRDKRRVSKITSQTLALLLRTVLCSLEKMKILLNVFVDFLKKKLRELTTTTKTWQGDLRTTASQTTVKLLSHQFKTSSRTCAKSHCTLLMQLK